jgi:hypothetical protein
VGRPFQAAGRLESLPHKEKGFCNLSLDGRGKGRVIFREVFNAVHYVEQLF